MTPGTTRPGREIVVEIGLYRAVIGPGVLRRLGELIREAAPAHRYVIITDEHVGPLYAEVVRSAVGASNTHLLAIQPGEAEKTRETWARLTDRMLEIGLARDTVVLALGGGVIGDLAGFVAATYMRGVPIVQLPTSLLAMIDASVGGKTGVDTAVGKNLVGAFHPPAIVVADTDVLRTLPVRHLRAGLAEAIKHGVVANERHFEAVVERAPSIGAGAHDAADLSALVAESVGIKAAVVRLDERERGLRKILNFGHTVGHAIEFLSDYTLLHGEAIAIGMVLESAIAERMGVAEPGTAARINAALRHAELPTTVPIGMTGEEILRATQGDKKARSGVVEYALPARIGAMAGSDRGWGTPVPDQLVREAVDEG